MACPNKNPACAVHHAPYKGHAECRGLKGGCQDDLLTRECFTNDDIKLITAILDARIAETA